MQLSEQAPVSKRAKPFASPSWSRAVFQLGNTLLIYGLAIYAMFMLLPISYGYTLLVSILATVAHVRLFMIGHDCVHQSYLPGKGWANTVLGNVIGVIVNTPLHYWGSQHLVHHQTVGNLDKRGAGDVDTLTVDEYRQKPILQRIWYRIGRNPIVLIFIFAPIHFAFMLRWPFESTKTPWAVWRSILGTNLGMMLYYGTMIALFGWEAVLLVYTPVILLSSFIAVWLFYVQHQFDDAYWVRSEDWRYQDATLQGSSFYDLPRWLHWATGNIGYHHLHHLNPKIPNYRLAACYASDPALQVCKSFRFWESFRLARLALWDETDGRLISFAEVDQASP